MKKNYAVSLIIFIVSILLTAIVSQDKINFLEFNILATSAKEKKIKNLNVTKYENLSIYYSDSDKDLLPLTKDSLELAINSNKDLFKKTYTTPYDVIIFESKREIESFSGLEYAISFNHPEISTIGILPEDKDALLKNISPIIWNYQKNILHEYTHYFFSQRLIELDLSETDIPFWFKEGISEYIGFNGITITTLDTPIVPLSKLNTGDQWNTYRTDPAYNVYLQSYLVINFLINEYGSDVINTILVEAKIENNFEKGLFNVTNLSFSELEILI